MEDSIYSGFGNIQYSELRKICLRKKSRNYETESWATLDHNRMTLCLAKAR